MQPSPVRRSSGLVCRYRLDRDYVRAYPDTYVHRTAELDAVMRAQALMCWSGGRGILAGWSAAAMWGTKWIGTDVPAVVNLPDHRRAPTGAEIYRDTLAATDHTLWRSFDVTTPVRTAFDLGRRLPLDDAVEVIDAIFQATALTPEGLQSYAAAHSGVRGVRRLLEAVALSDGGAESPWETRTRLAVLRAGLPAPESQLHVRDCHDRLIGRFDLGWPQWRVIVEYDGDQHFERTARNRDIERWNALEAAGWRVIRVKARQLTHGRELLLNQIRTVLRDRGAPV